MRLPIVEKGLRPLQKAILGMMKLMTGGLVPGPMVVLSYRRELCGQYLAACYQEGMRAATEWTVEEVETMAAFVSKLNACRY
jgi:hypothetical protein